MRQRRLQSTFVSVALRMVASKMTERALCSDTRGFSSKARANR